VTFERGTDLTCLKESLWTLTKEPSNKRAQY